MRSRSLLPILVFAFAGCDSASGEMREWTPADHDVAPNNVAPGQVAPRDVPSGQATDPALVDLAWQRNCAKCHGLRGRGDGPEGAMVRATDLTAPEWQAKVTDDDILASIRKGKNKMPGFEGALPAPILQGLVKRIRANRAP